MSTWVLMAYNTDDEGGSDDLGDLVEELREYTRYELDSQLGRLRHTYGPHDADVVLWRYAGVDGAGITNLELVSIDCPSDDEFTVWLYVQIYNTKELVS